MVKIPELGGKHMRENSKEKSEESSSCQAVTNEIIQSVAPEAKGYNSSCMTTCSGACSGKSGYAEHLSKNFGCISQSEHDEPSNRVLYAVVGHLL